MTLSRLATSALYERYTPAGIAGYGGWASITDTTGSPTTGTYTDGNGVQWRYWQWTSSGSVTTTAGVVDVLLVGGGSGYIPAWGGGGDLDEQPGGGGDVQMGLYSVASGTKTVTVGAGAAASVYPWGGPGQASSLGSIATRSGRLYGMDSNGLAAGVTSSITGTSITYSLGGATGEPSRAPGCGGSTSNRTGSNGVVVVRVPTTPELWGSPAMPPHAQITNFTASGTFSVPLTCEEVEICVVGGGGGGGYTNGGGGSTPVVSTQAVTPGESLTVTIGAGGGALANGTASTVVGSFGTVTGTGGTHSTVSSNNAHGTVTDFGFFGGGGSPNGNYFPGRPGGGNGNVGSGGYSGHPNTGGGGGGSGGGPGAGSGGSGYVAILAK